MTAIQLHDVVLFRENETTPAAGHVTRVWAKPTTDPYVTISSEGRTFVRLSSTVAVTREAQTAELPDSCPACGSEIRTERYYVPGRTGMPVTCGDEWHDEED